MLKYFKKKDMLFCIICLQISKWTTIITKNTQKLKWTTLSIKAFFWWMKVNFAQNTIFAPSKSSRRSEKRFSCVHKVGNFLLSRPGFPGSTIDDDELNFCVRDGNRCILASIITDKKLSLFFWLTDKANRVHIKGNFVVSYHPVETRHALSITT